MQVNPPDRQIPERVRVPRVARNASEWVQFRTDDAEWLLWSKTCKQCHTLNTGAGPLPVVANSNLTARWLPHAQFDHHAHRMMTCSACHANTLEQPRDLRRAVARHSDLPAVPSRRQTQGSGRGALFRVPSVPRLDEGQAYEGTVYDPGVAWRGPAIHAMTLVRCAAGCCRSFRRRRKQPGLHFGRGPRLAPGGGEIERAAGASSPPTAATQR